MMNTPSALITGASSGIGMVFARELAKRGYSVTCVARREEKLRKLVASLGEQHRYIRADLTNVGDLEIVSRDIDDAAYSLLINNAGYGIYDRFGNTPLEEHEKLMFLNMSALVRLSYGYLKKARRGDALVNVSSVLSRLPYPGGAVYSGTKAFVANLTEALWYEYRDRGIYVMALLPGVTDTDFHTVAHWGKGGKAPVGPSYPPDVVVREALDALRARKKPSLISGPRYRLLAALSGLMSRTRLVSMMGENSSGLDRTPA